MQGQQEGTVSKILTQTVFQVEAITKKCCAVGMRFSTLRESKISRYRTETGDRERGGPCPAEHGPALLSVF